VRHPLVAALWYSPLRAHSALRLLLRWGRACACTIQPWRAAAARCWWHIRGSTRHLSSQGLPASQTKASKWPPCPCAACEANPHGGYVATLALTLALTLPLVIS